MFRLSKFYIIFLLFSLSLFSLFIKPAFSQSYQSPLLSEGGVDTHVYKCDTVLFEATAMEDGESSLSARTFSAGLSMLHSPYLSIFYIPLKYGLNDNFQISFSLPFLTKTLVYNDTHYIKSGYGDTMLGLTGSFEPLSFFSTITTARITLPTGNTNAQDFDYYIPMGYGGYTASLQETISIGSFDTGFFTTRLFISGIGIYYFESTQKIDQIEKNTFAPDYAWSAMGGIEFGITENLAIQLKGNYINISERKYENNAAPGISVDANDSVKQINVLPFIKYRFLDDIIGQAGIIYPVKSTQDSDLITTYDAKWKIAFGIEKRFSDGPRNDSSNEKNSKEKIAPYKSVESKKPSPLDETVKKTAYTPTNTQKKKNRKRR